MTTESPECTRNHVNDLDLVWNEKSGRPIYRQSSYALNSGSENSTCHRLFDTTLFGCFEILRNESYWTRYWFVNCLSLNDSIWPSDAPIRLVVPNWPSVVSNWLLNKHDLLCLSNDILIIFKSYFIDNKTWVIKKVIQYL